MSVGPNGLFLKLGFYVYSALSSCVLCSERARRGDQPLEQLPLLLSVRLALGRAPAPSAPPPAPPAPPGACKSIGVSLAYLGVSLAYLGVVVLVSWLWLLVGVVEFL